MVWILLRANATFKGLKAPALCLGATKRGGCRKNIFGVRATASPLNGAWDAYARAWLGFALKPFSSPTKTVAATIRATATPTTLRPQGAAATRGGTSIRHACYATYF